MAQFESLYSNYFRTVDQILMKNDGSRAVNPKMAKV
jgi:hypothetical protein